MKPQDFSFESMGTNWSIKIWDTLSHSKFIQIQNEIKKNAQEFDNTYSRFIKTSFVRKTENKTGKIKVPSDFINMLLLYGKLNYYSNGIINPLIGQTISDLGYDEKYSLTEKNDVRKTPNFSETIQIIDSTHINKSTSALFDVGAIGKGYFVDLVSLFLYNKGIKRFLVDGSGDIFYQGDKKITCGLEHPDDPQKVIGKIEVKTGAMCASGINRRKWKNKNHIINPLTNNFPEEIIASWVLSDSAAISDGLSTALFFCPPENFTDEFQFEYLLLNKDYRVKRSKGFNAILY